MKLKAVELQGFKSFPDRTKLTFDDGITVIVGPNGSGKSNISDAIKWVFGEQSVKSLRGTKMEDVIFTGSVSRKPTGFAWVSLFIDNTDRSIDVDSDEVIITRRLYRSGESEYRINNNPVRLRDLNELFMDTGLGRDGYSIIEQGKIAEIVSAKSTQRREIFEEAAGISKFRHRKTEAERKLLQAEDNLVRLRDIMGELEGRVGPLRVQAEKAKQYLVLAEERKTLEVSLWLLNLEKLRVLIREQEDKLLLAENDRNTSARKMEEIESSLREISEKMQDAAAFIERKRGAIREIEERVGQDKVDSAVKKNNLEHNKEKIAGIDRELEESSISGSALEERLAELAKALSEKEAELHESEAVITAEQEALEEKRREENRVKTERQSLLLQREELRQKLHREEISGETAGSLAEDLAERLKSLREQAKEKDENLARQKEELAEHEAFAAELSEKLEGLKNSKNGYAFKYNSRISKLSEMEERRTALDRQAGEKLQRAKVLGDLERNLENFNQSVRLIMKQAEAGALRGIIGPVSSLIKTDNRYASAVEISLGGAIQNIVTSDEGAAKRAIAFLRERKGGRATFLPLTNMKPNPIREASLASMGGYVGLASELVTCDSKYRGIIDYLLARTIVAEDLDAATAIAKSFQHRYRVVTLDGQVVNAGGSMTGGSVNKNASILSRRGEIETLSREAKALVEKSDALEEEMKTLRQEAETIKATMDGIEAEEKTAGEDLLRVNTLLGQLRSNVAESERISEEALAEFDRLTARVEELKNQKLSSTQTMKTLEQETEQLSVTIESLLEQASLLTGEIADSSEALTQKQLAYIAIQKDRDSLAEQKERMNEQKNDSAGHTAALRAQREALLRENEETERMIEELERRTSDSGGETRRLQEEIAETQNAVLSLEARETVLRTEDRETIALHEASAAEITRLKDKMNGYTEQQNSIFSKMWDEYELTRTDAAAVAIPLEHPEASQKRLAELKSKIRSLGSVNVAAIDEFKEISERYYFLKEQIDDAETSKKELTKLIADLAAEMSIIFKDRFESINRHFAEIFKELFGGGHAALTLSDPSDPLETGIDITVQPPGKIIKSLSSLSGGEQAFVAICIYFAILKVNPAPFVLIDEIEAALDDVNVSKFAAYLHRMTDHTQFISITHRRGTMEEGDVLYGVTMEEEGVSKLLRLNVAEMEKKFLGSLS